MQFHLNHVTLVVVMFFGFCILYVSSDVSSLSCNSCGEECTDACGTRHFRTCCFNYLRKRNGGGSSGGGGGGSANFVATPSSHPSANELQSRPIAQLTQIDMDKLAVLVEIIRQNDGKITDEMIEFFKALDRNWGNAYKQRSSLVGLGYD